jgi:hypothetical protein
MRTLFISYYSDLPENSFYKDSAIRLESKIKNLGGSLLLKELPNLGSYAKNCLRKPQFILDCLNEINDNIIWIDCDSQVNQLPIEFDIVLEDVACVEKANGCPESSLIYFKNSEHSRNFLKTWIDQCNATEIELDHPVLKDLWNNKQHTETRKSLDDSICSVRLDSKITIILSKTQGKSEHTRKVMERRKKEGRIV